MCLGCFQIPPSRNVVHAPPRIDSLISRTCRDEVEFPETPGNQLQANREAILREASRNGCCGVTRKVAEEREPEAAERIASSHRRSLQGPRCCDWHRSLTGWHAHVGETDEVIVLERPWIWSKTSVRSPHRPWKSTIPTLVRVFDPPDELIGQVVCMVAK